MCTEFLYSYFLCHDWPLSPYSLFILCVWSVIRQRNKKLKFCLARNSFSFIFLILAHQAPTLSLPSWLAKIENVKRKWDCMGQYIHSLILGGNKSLQFLLFLWVYRPIYKRMNVTAFLYFSFINHLLLAGILSLYLCVFARPSKWF